MLNNGGDLGDLCNWSYRRIWQNSEQLLRRTRKWASHSSRFLKLTNKEENKICRKSLYLTPLLLFYGFPGADAFGYGG